MGISKGNHTSNSTRNLIFGLLLKIYQILMPFIIRTYIIYSLGIEYAGLNSLFISVLSVLNIAELGVGTIMVYYMYKPIEECDTARICALMQLYKLYYRIIGIVVLSIGMILTPLLPDLVKGEVPSDVNLYVLYYINLTATVISYWLFAYKNSLFLAHQRVDIISKISIFTDTIKYILQLFVIFVYKNYYYYVIITLFVQLFTNILTGILSDRSFPNYRACGYLPKIDRRLINASIRDVFFGQLGMVVTISVDSIVISVFLGLVQLGQYQNYYFVTNSLIGFFAIFYQSIRASIGTNIIIKSKQENFKDFIFINYIIFGLITFCSSCLINLYQPFIEIWVGKENLLNFGIVILIVLNFLLVELSLLIGCYKDISGKWHADRYRPLITAAFNLFTNIILVQKIGIYGILISTAISFLLINIPWLYTRVFIDVFDISMKVNYLLYILKKLIQLIVIILINTLICIIFSPDNLFVKICLNLLVCFFVTLIVYCSINNHEESQKRFFLLIKNKLW